MVLRVMVENHPTFVLVHISLRRLHRWLVGLRLHFPYLNWLVNKFTVPH
jgi:hypothetical protein